MNNLAFKVSPELPGHKDEETIYTHVELDYLANPTNVLLTRFVNSHLHSLTMKCDTIAQFGAIINNISKIDDITFVIMCSDDD